MKMLSALLNQTSYLCSFGTNKYIFKLGSENIKWKSQKDFNEHTHTHTLHKLW